MLRRFLLIGVGGSGGKTLRYTWRELDRRLRAAEWKHGVPEAWRFLHIDVPENPDVIEGDVPVTMGSSAHYLGLARAPQQYREYDRALCERAALLPAVAGWRPDPGKEYAAPHKGAGQRRAVGRVVTLTQLDKVGEALDRTVTALAGQNVTTELNALNRHLGMSDIPTNAEPATAMVISSLGGGAGSGAFLDVIELLLARATEQAQWLANSLVTVLYASDVFSHINEQQRAGIEPNSLAALSELLSAYEHEGQVNEIESNLLDLGGGTAPVLGRRTARTNFIIGVKNEAVAFNHSLDVFRSVGKALATYMSDDAVQGKFITYVDTNPSSPSISPQFGITALDSLNQPCSSFGYANVSLGRTIFAQYASERLAKRAINRLLRGHKERLDPDSYRRDEALIAEIAEQNKESFFDATGLWELSTSHNQVLDAFRDRELKKQALDGVVSQVRTTLQGDTRKRSPKEWLQSVTGTFDDLARSFEEQERAQRTMNARRWVPEIQARVLRETARSVGNHGIPVTLALLDHLITQVNDAADELERDSHKFSQEETSLLNRTQQLFSTLREKVIMTSHANFKSAAQHRRDALQRRTESDLYGFTASVLRDLSRNFLPQLASALKNAQSSLAAAENRQHRDLVAQWSESDVPPHLRAAPNELLLTREPEFPDTYARLLQEAFGIDGARTAESAALEEIVSGVWKSIYGELGQQHFLQQTSQWQPSRAEARDPSAGASTAAFEYVIDPPKLLEHAEKWVREREGRVSEYVRETLREWLAPDREDAADRANRFVDSIGQALTSAHPLISVNGNVFRAVHGDDPPIPAFVLSQIPIGETHVARKRIEEKMREVGMTDGDIVRVFNPNAGGGEIEISSFLGRSVHPIVFDSLLGPVQRDWQKRTDDASRSQFWQFRRARTMASYIPMSPSKQEAFVRGWLSVNLLGQVDVLMDRWSVQPLTVWTPRGRKRFPRYLLGRDVSKHAAVLPALLESMPLALLAFASDPEASEMAAYVRLLQLGGSPHGLDDREHDLNPELAGWLTTGTTTSPDPGFDPAPVPPEAYAGSAAGTQEERAEAMIRMLRQYEAGYRELAARQITRETTLQVGPGWEIREVVLRATGALIAGIEQLPVASLAGVADPFMAPDS